jgi:hypothetical protein
MCELLEKEYNKAFGGEYSFRPEPISDGGIVFKSWPGKNPEQYKTLRLHTHGFPWITEETFQEWKTCDEAKELLFLDTYNYQRIGRKPPPQQTTLKAFRGAPKWKVEELHIWTRCFEEVGITVVGWKTRLTQRKLDQSFGECCGAW